MTLYPTFYSFRRCPYAIRARYFLVILSVHVQLREIALKAKPEALLSLGGRTSVPQLIDQKGGRYPESLDIIFWALKKTRNQSLATELWPSQACIQKKMLAWVKYNDRFFKHWLDRYKYADRYPEFTESVYRKRGELFLRRLEKRLSINAYIMGDVVSFADICLFPFVRQFASVDSAWFHGSRYLNVRRWLAHFLESEVFSVLMKKYPKWEEGQNAEIFPAL